MLIPEGWKDFELLDCGDGMKLERWGEHLLARPDPQALWPKSDPARWRKARASYRRQDGGGYWDSKHLLPSRWQVAYGSLRFWVRPTDFKHTGLFPEQAVHWDWMRAKVSNAGRQIRALNLFGYTGAATVALAKAGASVAHVDAARGVLEWCKDNLALNGLSNVRTIADDVSKFCWRELKRGRRYDAVVLDPPSYGRGKSGETWNIEKHLWPLLCLCARLLSSNPLFVLLNSYTAGYAPQVMANLLQAALPAGGVENGELGLRQSRGGLVLPCGIYARWEPA